eukprot:SAG31_NODE_9067_length_1340_cov_56.550363_1_plen_223_part_01
MPREPKKSCIDCHQSKKSCPARKYLICTRTNDCGRSNLKKRMRLEDLPINLCCVDCLEANYGGAYCADDLRPDSFVCPVCRGFERPSSSKRGQSRAPPKRTLTTGLKGQLVLFVQTDEDEDVLLPALRITRQSWQSYLAELTHEEAEAAKKLQFTDSECAGSSEMGVSSLPTYTGNSFESAASTVSERMDDSTIVAIDTVRDTGPTKIDECPADSESLDSIAA